jgi:hypothetical protein
MRGRKSARGLEGFGGPCATLSMTEEGLSRCCAGLFCLCRMQMTPACNNIFYIENDRVIVSRRSGVVADTAILMRGRVLDFGEPANVH